MRRIKMRVGSEKGEYTAVQKLQNGFIQIPGSIITTLSKKEI